MTIVAAPETRNAQWANDTTSFGRKMLAKMGWTGDGGLGKNQQGTSTHLRAVRRAESLGIGAENDAFGDKGFQETSAGFHGVLASLKKEYSGVGSGSSEDDEATRKKRRKEEKKRKKKEEKRKAKRAASGGSSNSSGGSSDEGGKGSGVRLAQNKVQAGHARKMREAKDLRNKSAADMAAIFGVKADVYSQKKDWVNGDGDEADASKDATSDVVDDAAEKREKKKAKKKAKEDKPKKEKKKRRRSDGGDDEADTKKVKKGKSKK